MNKIPLKKNLKQLMAFLLVEEEVEHSDQIKHHQLQALRTIPLIAKRKNPTTSRLQASKTVKHKATRGARPSKEKGGPFYPS